MEWMLWVIAIAVLGLAAVAASGRLGELPATVTDTPMPHLPEGAISGDDLRSARFSVVTRGYSMQQVDDLLDRLASQLDQAPQAVAEPSARGWSGRASNAVSDPDGIMGAVRSQGTSEVSNGSDETANR